MEILAFVIAVLALDVLTLALGVDTRETSYRDPRTLGLLRIRR
jgi:hypothetical protein